MLQAAADAGNAGYGMEIEGEEEEAGEEEDAALLEPGVEKYGLGCIGGSEEVSSTRRGWVPV